MLSKLFRSRVRFDDPDPRARREAILQLRHEELDDLQDDLLELARTDKDTRVRQTALSRIGNRHTLIGLCQDGDSQLAQAAATILAERCGTEPDLAGQLQEQGLRDSIIRAAQDPALIKPLLDQLPTDAQVTLSIESRNPRVRLRIAELIQDEPRLVELERLSRDRDKNLNRLARSRLDDIRQARANYQAAADQANALLRQLESLQPDDHLLGPKLARLKTDWLSTQVRLDECAQTLTEHNIDPDPVAANDARFQEQLAQLQPQAATPAATTGSADPAEPTPEAVPEADPALFQALLDELQALHDEINHGQRDPVTELDTLNQIFSAGQQRWLSAADHRPPPAELATPFHDLTHQMSLLFTAAQRLRAAASDAEVLSESVPEFAQPQDQGGWQQLWQQQHAIRQRRSQIDKLLRRIAWPADIQPPALLATLQTRHAELDTFDQRCHEAYQALTDSCRELQKNLQQQIEEGHLINATSLDTEARKLLRCLPEGGARQLHQREHQLAAQLKELKDWQTFATGPKRRELCEQAETLANNPMDPPVQAEHIKALRRAWQELGPITHPRDRRLLDRFNSAAERAFEPCRAYFEAEAEKRKFNLEQRETICEQLEQYLAQNDWNNTDWKGAERILHRAQSEWRKFFPVDRAAGKRTQQRFDTAIKALLDQLKGEWGRNLARKEEIISTTRSLLEQAREDSNLLPATIDQAKGLQRQWREVGITPRGPDQKLWKQFRALCDEIFGLRAQQHEASQQKRKAQLQAAEARCDEFAKQLEQTAPEQADPDVLAAFRRDMQAFGSLPPETAGRLQKRQRELETAYRQLLRQAELAAQQQAMDHLRQLDQQVGELEMTIGQGQAVDDGLIAELLNNGQNDPALQQRLTQLRDGASSSALQQLAARADEQRHRLVLEAEILAGLESPADDQQARLALQVEKLNQGLQQGTQVRTDASDLQQQWRSVGPWGERTNALADRFYTACHSLLKAGRP